jgi:MFS family permease
MTSPPPGGGRTAIFRVMFRALGHRDYRLFFGGQCVSQVGTWMQQMTVVWLAYRLTGDAFLVGVVGFCSQIPTFVLAPLAGVWADRFDRRQLLLATQALSLVQSGLLAALTLANVLTLWQLLLLVAVLGAVNAFDMTASQAFVKDLVHKREDLGSAIALNSAIINGARLIGPALAGILIHLVGEGGVFLLNAVSFLGVLAALAAMRPVVAVAAPAAHLPLGQSLQEGITYSYQNRPIRDLLVLVAILALFAMPYSLLPAFADQVLHGGARALGLLMGAAGLGAIVATLRVAARRSVVGAEGELVWASLGLAASLILMAAVNHLELALLCRLTAGYCVLLQTTTANTLIHTLVEDDQRGRVASIYTMAFLGALPLGNLLAGALAQLVGVAETFAVSGVCCLAGSAWFRLRLPAFRRETEAVYQRLGLVVAAMPTAPPR